MHRIQPLLVSRLGPGLPAVLHGIRGRGAGGKAHEQRSMQGHLMSSIQKSRIEIDSRQWSGFFDEIRTESDRGAAILASVWIEYLLEQKLKTLFTKGNSATRRKLFDHGPFSTFASKTLAAHCLGWIDSDTYHDVILVRKIRNLFAHELHGMNLESPKVQQFVDQFKTPSRYYYDWDELRAAATADGTGVIIFTGEPPTDVGDALEIQRYRYLWIVSLLVAEVSASLGIAIRMQK